MRYSLKKNFSKIHGFGIFSVEKIVKGKNFYKVPLKTIGKRNRQYAYIGGQYVSDEAVLNYINHSCRPNSKLSILGKPKLIAIKNILKGEEITCDYDKTEINGFQFKCNCGNKQCKHYIGKKK